MIFLRRLALSALMVLSIAAGSFSFRPEVAYAQADDAVSGGLDAIGDTVKLTRTDPRIIAARIINVALGLLGIIMVSIILFAGFQWMTSGGDPGKVAEAKTRIRNAVIGLIIILSAYALTAFVVRSLTEATGYGKDGGGGPGGPGGGALPGGGGASAFQLRSITPTGSVPLRNIEVRFIFTRDVEAGTAPAAIQILRASDSVRVDGTVTVSGSIVNFVPNAACPVPNESRRCFDADTEFIARVASTLRSSGGTALVCGGFAPVCEGRFTTGNIVDTAPPTGSIEYPLNGQGVPADDVVFIRTRATDDAGVSHVETSVDGALVGTGVGTSTATNIVTEVEWDTTGLSSGSRTLSSRVYDLDSNTGDAPAISVVVRPRHCFNGSVDADETDVDCGGADCGACTGGACTDPGACASGVCTAGVCVEQPVITAVTPNDGRPGTLVSISGVNFGTTPGAVIFSPRIAASAPAACTASGTPTWTRTNIVVALPEGAVDGPIEIENAASLVDRTNDARGPVLDDFDVNDAVHPGLCAVRPSEGTAGERVELVGVGLGTSSDRVTWNDRNISSFLSWADDTIAMNVPVFEPATYAVQAIVGGIESNAVAFRLNERVTTAGPIIDALSPADGPIGEYVTIQGRNFGGRIGQVFFRRGEADTAADIRFPEQCSVAYWSNTAVTVKVPETFQVGLGATPLTPGEWQIVLKRQDLVESNAAPFTVNTNEPKPGVCAILPGAGPVGTSVEIIGERFGAVGTGRATFLGPSGRVPMSVAAASWSGGRIQGRVPTGAIPGPVLVTQSSNDSNGVPFNVRNCNEDASICAVGQVCCRSGACSVGGTCPSSTPEAEFAWQLSTGILPVNPRVIEECSPTRPASPSPWSGRAGGDRVCVNSELFIRFTTPLNPASVVISGPDASLVIRKCTGPAENPCLSASDPIPPAVGVGWSVGVDGPAETGQGYIQFFPAALWDGNATYQVILTTGIRSNTNVPMLSDYRFTFTTRGSSELCRVGSVSVVPESATLNDIGATQSEMAVPRSADDICVNLRADIYDWRWATSDGRAEVTNNVETRADGTRRGLERQTATARAETGASPVRVSSSMTQEGETIEGTGDLFVRLQPPRVIAYGPNCDEACLNAAAWVKFNTAIDPASVRRENVILRRCVNENCLSYDLDVDLSRARLRLTRAPDSTSDAETYLLLEPTGAGGTTLLEVGRFYRITLRGGDVTGIRSTNGLPLAGLNDPDGFSWTFRVKQGDDARCATARVGVVPGEKYELAVGARQSFIATPVSAPNACDANGSPLISDRSFAWGIDQPAPISRFINGGTGLSIGVGLVDTTDELPAGCSGSCLNLGSDGVDGRVASCGNGQVETTDTRYCRAGRTPFGDPCTLMPAGSRGGEECDEASTACSTTCKWNPMTGGTCGNRTINRGEQCDGGPGGIAGCSAECQLLGSRAGLSTCGNGDVAAGEACDDNNTTNGDGCSADCLHEGSIRVRALCGNARVEPGESCERPAAGAAFPAGCNTTTCLNEGTVPPVCGDADVDAGEDCDDGNLTVGDGCSARCLKEGSSLAYPIPSFCGDGVRGRGEMCESTGGDLEQDALQLADIVGEGEPDADGRMSSIVRTDYDTQRGQATYGLQCGFREESSCSGGNGLDSRGCCAPRPRLIGQYPEAGETGVCRNAQLSATFDVRMDEGSIQTSFVLAEEVAGAACPTGSTRVVNIEDYDPTPGFRGWVNRTWYRLMSWFRPEAAQAAWCAGSVRGRLSFEPAGSGTKAVFSLERALASSTRYQVLFRGDTDLSNNGDVANRVGIKSARGVVANGNILWDFTTGLRLCAVTAVHVRDTNVDSPNLFTRAAESHLYTSEIISLQDGRRIALSSVMEYAWDWEPWLASNREALEAEEGTDAGSGSRSNVAVVNPPKNGSSFIEAGIRIVRDDVNVPSTTGRIVKGSQTAHVMLCERPWPSRAQAPFSETLGHPSLELLGPSPLAASIRRFGPYFNFASLYCLDSGEAGPAGDLPPVNVQPVNVSAGDTSQGILRQYLFTFDDAALRGDGIGIRIATNPLHLAPAAWYASRGFTGTPENLTVDGYEAVKDGTTWYVGGINTANATAAPVYSQMYIISHNPDAKPETKNIVEQLVSNFTLNANIQNGASNACSYARADGTHVAGELYRGSNGKVVRCTADWECLSQNPNLRCASFKAKMQRDSKRVVDFQFMTEALESSRERAGNYPRLQAGTFVPTLATSRWPSWSSQLQGEVGASFPTDPVNRFLTCGVCSESGAPCQDASECPSGQTCRAAARMDGIEPATCWNPNVRQYQCPQLTEGVRESASRIYQYRSINAGQRYELATELEGAIMSRYVPRLLTEIKRCSNLDAPCVANADCDVTNSLGRVVSAGTCNGTGGTWRYHGVCEASSVYGVGGNICGDGVVGTSELCELGDTTPLACELPGGVAGTKLQICDDCARFIDGPDTRCVQNVQCGNGRVDTDETCDDGALNGTYGRCNRTCTGYDAFCGDGRISPGESCDLGARNGEHCNSSCDATASCSLSCTGPGPRCGDGDVNGPEQCDGNAERSTKALCVAGANAGQTCDTDTDCPESSCPVDGPNKPCTSITARRCTNDRTLSCTADTDCRAGISCTAGRCSNIPTRSCTSVGDCTDARCLSYPTSRVRTCQPYGGPDPADACTWNGWSACEPTNYCGDGVVDAGEDCDDGNRSNNDACTNACKPNVCGDNYYYTGVEECDLGRDNGLRTCTADYGSTCLSCSSSCRQVASSGGYCGNGVREGSEQCDGTQGLGSCSVTRTQSCTRDSDCPSSETCNTISCRGLGFDYARQVSCSHYSYARRQSDGSLVCITRPCLAGTPSSSSVLCSSNMNDRCYFCSSGDCGIDWFPATEINAESVVDGSIAETVCRRDRLYAGQPIRRDALTCTSSCGMTGCVRCGDVPGTGTISGQVFDAVNYVYPVHNARVTLYNRGLPVGAPAFTDSDGRFSFTTLDTNSSCASYRILVDYYQDNACTGTGRPEGLSCNGREWTSSFGPADESVNGGYWPFESGTFGVSTFRSAGLRSDTDKIYLMPRVAPDETLAVTTFRGSRTFGTYIQFPVDQAFKQKESFSPSYVETNRIPPNAFGFDLCELTAKDGHEPNYDAPACRASNAATVCTDSWAPGACNIPSGASSGFCYKYNCIRTLYWGLQGNRDLDVTPHGEIVCRKIESDGSVSPSCYYNQSAPFVARFKKGPWNSSGHYSFWLVDLETNAAPPSYQEFTAASATVTIVTHDRIYTATPPAFMPSCTPSPGVAATSQRPWDPATVTDGTNGRGKYWLVFQENAISGDVALTNQLLCRGSSIPNEESNFDPNLTTPSSGSPAYPLPWPLIWSDSRYSVPR